MSMREEFEKWAEGRGFYLTLFRDSDYYRNDDTAFAWSAWQAATRVEREACAKACEESADGFGGHGDWASGYVAALDDIAEGIRARGDA